MKKKDIGIELKVNCSLVLMLIFIPYSNDWDARKEAIRIPFPIHGLLKGIDEVKKNMFEGNSFIF